MSDRILVIDDDPGILSALSRYLQTLGYEVRGEGTGYEGLEAARSTRPDVVVLDLDLPDTTGLDILEEIRENGAVVIMLTGAGDIPSAVRAMQLGAENYLTKPVELAHLGAVVARAAEKSHLRRENVALKVGGRDGGPAQLEALGVSPMMSEIGRKVGLLAESDRSTVLLTGESGTGKGWVARLLHRLGPRTERPFVQVNCAGLTSTFLASELFGHEKGAFTDAREAREGLFEAAHTGVLFLDEVGDLAPDLQPKLLKVLEDRSFRRLGGTREITVDVRLVAATNRDLEAAVEAGEFREDLYYRLNVARVHIPAVRERSPEDRAALLHQLNDEVAVEMRKGPGRISDDALVAMVDYEWPGNIREMRNVMQRAAIFAGDADELLVEHLPAELQRSRPRTPGARFRPESLEEVERRHIERMLRYHDGNRTHSARDLGIARGTLIKKIRKYDLDL